MVRQKPRKSVEELYAPKFDTSPLKSQVPHVSNTSKSMRSDYGGFVISSNKPYTTTTNNCNPGNNISQVGVGVGAGRRKSTRPPTLKMEKTFVKENKMLNPDETKTEHAMKQKTTRSEKCRYNSPNLQDTKNYVNFVDTNPRVCLQNQHHHHHHHPSCQDKDDDKDDDTEEFFELIRQTVENAIAKSISDVLNRHVREITTKVERFSTELKATNSLLTKLQAELSNKVVHYGEENSRHFRYLCMKSEYDKMFYQHHTMLSSQPVPKPEKISKVQLKQPSGHNTSDTPQNSCTCRSSNKTSNIAEPKKSSSAEEHSISGKSSEMGMREVLEHIQRFCNQMQLSDPKCDDRTPKSSFHHDESIKINKQIFDEDDDEFQLSSDGMTPRSEDNNHKFRGNSTLRSRSAPHTNAVNTMV